MPRALLEAEHGSPLNPAQGVGLGERAGVQEPWPPLPGTYWSLIAGGFAARSFPLHFRRRPFQLTEEGIILYLPSLRPRA